MKPIKMLGLTALAALMAMAFAGASSAMAEDTALCVLHHEIREGCTGIGHVHESTLPGHKMVLKTSIVTIECDVLFLGDGLVNPETGLPSGSPLIVHGKLTYTNCGSCTFTEENGPAEFKVLREGKETGSMVGEYLSHLECSGVNCRFPGTGIRGTVKGSLKSIETNGEVSINEQLLSKESGLFCPSTSYLTITTTPLLPTDIVEHFEVDEWCLDNKFKEGEYKDPYCLEKEVNGLYLIN